VLSYISPRSPAVPSMTNSIGVRIQYYILGTVLVLPEGYPKSRSDGEKSMTFTDTVAGVSGAVLGYIAGNVKGAQRGYKAGKFLSRTKRMPPIPQKRKSTYGGGGARKKANWKAKPSGVRFSKKPTAVQSFRSLGSNASAVGRTAKGIKQMRRKTPKVSAAFRQKVEKALHGTMYGELERGNPARCTAIAANDSQQVFQDGILFTPLDFFDAADIMFDLKTPALVPLLATSNFTNGYIRKDVVVDSYATFEMKNFSQRTYTVNMFNCAPKTLPLSGSATSLDPLTAWIFGLTQAFNNGTNPGNNLVTQLFMDPRHNPEFATYWKPEVTTVVLQPGQSHTFTVLGPKGIEIDYTKHFIIPASGVPSVILPYAKFSRGVFFTYHMDIVSSSLAGIGRYLSTGAGTGGLGYEKRVHFKMRVPDDAGFKYPAAFVVGAPQQLNLRLPARIKVYFPTGAAGVAQDVLEDNPIAVIDPLD